MKRPRWFALILQEHSMGLVDLEHGLLVHEPMLAARQGRRWRFGPEIERGQRPVSVYQSPEFPLQDWLVWFLERVYPLRKLKLLLIWPESPSALTLHLWKACLNQLGIAESRVVSPLDCLAPALQSSLLIYLDGGLAGLAACVQGRVQEATYLGYGRFLTRAVRRYALEKHTLRVDFQTAESLWQRLGAFQQVTVSGQDLQGRLRHQLLLAEDLEPMVIDALTPLVREVHYLQAVYPDLPCQLLGNQNVLPGLESCLAQQLPASAEKIEAGDQILIQSIQAMLQEVKI